MGIEDEVQNTKIRSFLNVSASIYMHRKKRNMGTWMGKEGLECGTLGIKGQKWA